MNRRDGAAARLSVMVGAGFACLYLFTAPLRIENIDGQVRFEVSWALLREGRPVPAHRDYLRLVVVKGRRAEAVSYYGIGQSLLALPAVAAASRMFGGSRVAAEIAFALLNPLMGGTAVGLYLLLVLGLGYRATIALGSAIVIGLGSCLWPASVTCMEGPLVAVYLLLLALAVLWRQRAGGRGPLVAGGVAIGLILITRETDAAAALPLLLALLFARPSTWLARARAAGVIGMCALPLLAIYVGYNYWRYNSALSLFGRLQVLRDQGYPAYGHPLRALYGLTLSPDKGIVFFSPLVVLSALGWPWLWRRAPLPTAAITATIVFTLLTIIPLAAWRGDWTWGPRYLFGVAPLMLLGLPAVLERCHGPLRRAGLAVVLGIAITVQLAAVAVFYSRYFLHFALERDYIYGLRPDLSPPSQLLYHLRELPVVGRRTLLRLSNERDETPVTRALDVASAPASPSPLRQLGPVWADSVANFDTIPFFWIYYDLASRGRLRVPLRMLAGLLLAETVIALGVIAPRMAQEQTAGSE